MLEEHIIRIADALERIATAVEANPEAAPKVAEEVEKAVKEETPKAKKAAKSTPKSEPEPEPEEEIEDDLDSDEEESGNATHEQIRKFVNEARATLKAEEGEEAVQRHKADFQKLLKNHKVEKFTALKEGKQLNAFFADLRGLTN